MKPRKQLTPVVCLLVNQFAFPGLGTILNGRHRVTGYLQAALMVAGFLLTVWFFCLWTVANIRYLSNNAWSEEQFRALYRPHLWALQWGLGFTAVAWCWSLVSSLLFLRPPNRTPPPLP